MSPFLILRLVDFIAQGSSKEELSWETARPGVILSALLIGTQFLSQFILQHVQYAQVMMGVRSTNAVISIIYAKHGRISNATNKQFESGEIVNFI